MGRCVKQSLLNVLSEHEHAGTSPGREKSILPRSIQMHESFHQIHEGMSNVQKRGEGNTSVRKSVGRSIICEECNLPRRTHHWSDVCEGCLSNLPKVRCARA